MIAEILRAAARLNSPSIQYVKMILYVPSFSQAGLKGALPFADHSFKGTGGPGGVVPGRQRLNKARRGVGAVRSIQAHLLQDRSQ